MLKTKYLLPLILILLLTFTLVSNCADLFGTYDQRIKLTIDNTKIDSDLTWFPVLIKLTNAQMEEVFAEFDSDDDFDRCAITLADESTQIYGDCERFDDSGEVAEYHVAKTGVVTDADAAGYLYFYYDKDAAHNATYVDKTGGKGTQYPTAHTADYVKSTTEFGANYEPYRATDPANSLTGGDLGTNWYSTNTVITNQRFHIDLGSAKVINKIYYENAHDSGGETDRGVQNFTFQGSNTGAGTFDDLVYANDEGWTTLTTSQATFDEHVGADQADPKYITVTNATAYRYYAFKFADNYGDTALMGVRHIALQKTTVAENVYDANFKAVYHMDDDTTSTILDSTSNTNHGTKLAANQPTEIAGKVGQAQDYDGTDDRVRVSDDASLDITNNITIQAIIKTSDTSNYKVIVVKCDGSADPQNYQLRLINTGYLSLAFYNAGWIVHTDTQIDLDDNAYHHVAVTYDQSDVRFYVDGAAVDSFSESTAMVANEYDFMIGELEDDTTFTFHDIIDEVSVSNTAVRSAAWIKATKESLWDSLLTYGSEETSGVVTANILFTFTEF